MKKTFTRILLLTMVACMLCVVLASCSGPRGEYYVGDMEVTKSYVTYTFKWGKLTTETYVAGNKIEDATMEYSYKVKGDEITLTYTDDDGEEHSSTQTFEKTEDGDIKLGVITLKKIKK